MQTHLVLDTGQVASILLPLVLFRSSVQHTHPPYLSHALRKRNCAFGVLHVPAPCLLSSSLAKCCIMAVSKLPAPTPILCSSPSTWYAMHAPSHHAMIGHRTERPRLDYAAIIAAKCTNDNPAVQMRVYCWLLPATGPGLH